MVQSIDSDIAPLPGAVPRLIPPGRPGAEAAVAMALARSVLLLRFGLSLLCSVVGLATLGFSPDTLEQVGPPFALIAIVTLAELSVLPHLAPGRPRVALVASDAAVALSVLALGLGDPIYVVFQTGTAALAGAVLGMLAVPLWFGQAVQAGTICWVLLDDIAAPTPATLLLLVAPALILLAGTSALAVSHQVLARLGQDTHPEGSPHRIADDVEATFRLAALAAVRLPRWLRGQPELADSLARTVALDAVTALEDARRPVRGIQFDSPEQDLAEPLEQLCRGWSLTTRVMMRTELGAAWPPVPVRHELARILHDALSNIADHAHATRARVALVSRGERLTLTIEDNGRGFDVPGAGLTGRDKKNGGIAVMAARARGVGATFTVTSQLYSGTVVTIRTSA